MDPVRFPPLSRCRTVVVSWADLPPELLAAIAGGLQYPMDVDRFRSVCRQWRLSICPPPPPNKISHLFPRGVSFCLKPHFKCESRAAKYLIARAVYLLRPPGEPSKAWMVSVEEINPGKLLLRHPLTYKEEQGSPTNGMDLSEWSVTRISTSYRFRVVYGRGKSMKQCSQCNYSVCTKVILVSNNSESEDMALYNYDSFSLPTKLCAFRLSLSDQTSASQYVGGLQKGIRDFVNFNARIYAVDMGARVYLFDSTSLQLLQMKRGNFIDSLWAKGSFKRFVVSEGHLYLVLKFCPGLGTWRDCRIYKLVMDDSDPTFYNLEKVENLGDRVFFINRDCCFSVSHRDLPPPLKGNCVIVSRNAFRYCECFVSRNAFRYCECFRNNEDFDVFHLGGKPQEFGLMSSLQVYSALFTPPWLWINQKREKKLRRVFPRNANSSMNNSPPTSAADKLFE